MGWQALLKQARQPLVHLIVGIVEPRLWYCDVHGALHEAKLLSTLASRRSIA
jgi:hypothetical protein